MAWAGVVAVQAACLDKTIPGDGAHERFHDMCFFGNESGLKERVHVEDPDLLQKHDDDEDRRHVANQEQPAADQ